MIFSVHVKPGARETKIDAVLDETTFKISVAAEAKEGKANRELIRFLSKSLRVPQSHVEIVRGAQTRLKHVRIDGASIENIKKTL